MQATSFYWVTPFALLYFTGTWYYSGLGGLPVDKQKSFHLQYEAAMHGHPNALYNVATAYLEGDGIMADAVKAKTFYERSILKGNVHAVLNLGNMFRLGTYEGVPKDLPKALHVFRIAANVNAECKKLANEVEKEMKQAGMTIET